MSNPALLSPLKVACVEAFFILCSLWSLPLIPKFSFAEIQRFFGLDTFLALSYAVLLYKKAGSEFGFWPALSRPKHAYVKCFLQSLCPGSGRPHGSVTVEKGSKA